MPRLSMFVLVFLSTAVTACENRSAEAAASTSAAMVASAAPATEAAAKVSRIVFVGKEHACDCTRKKIETAQAALQKLLGEPPRIPIETYQIDTQEEKVAPYRQLRPMMAVPALYFIDAKGGLVEMLQGEITEAQVSKALGS